MPNNLAYHLVFWIGVGLIVLAFVLPFILPLPHSVRFWVVGVTGLAGSAIASAAKRLKSD